MREALLGAERLGMAARPRARARAHSGISQFRFARMTGPGSKSACNLPIAAVMPCDDTWRDAHARAAAAWRIPISPHYLVIQPGIPMRLIIHRPPREGSRARG